jgi:NAD(P)-dependent dehydrogenase (short-subunit alcohol dehydrogenase family)
MSWSVGAGLEGKGVVVTGAAGGIGAEVARAFAVAGARVCAVDVKEDGLAELLPTLEGGPHRSEALDLRELPGHEGLLRRTASELGGLDVLANMAAVLIRRGDIDEVTEEDWDFQHDVNLKAGFFLNRAAARIMREQGRGGRIINFTSQGWWTGGFGGSVVYSATKGGIVSMSRGLARTYAKDGITVNTVSPGAVDTPMLRGGLTDEQLEAHISQIPLGYMAEPADLAGTVVFLASDHARYITGATLNVSGGWLMY